MCFIRSKKKIIRIFNVKIKSAVNKEIVLQVITNYLSPLQTELSPALTQLLGRVGSEISKNISWTAPGMFGTLLVDIRLFGPDIRFGIEMVIKHGVIFFG